MATVEELQAQAAPFKPEIARIKATIGLIATGQEVTLNDAVVVSVVTRSGYAVWSDAKRRLVLTDKGTKFYRAMKRFGHLA